MTFGSHRPAGERLAVGAAGAGQALGKGKAAGAALREARAMAAESRREPKPHMGRRLFGWDYRQPSIYVVTIVCADRRARLFGEVEVLCDGEWLSIAEARQAKPEPDEIEARVALSALGKAVFAHFRRIGDFTPEIVPIFCAVMPDHLHLLLRVTREMARPLGNAIAGFKTGCEKIYARSGGSGRLFAEGFVDHVIMREGQLAREFDYLREARRDELLAEARRGAVLLSPCVSDGEREIAREALAAGLSLVTMHNKGFAPLQKPAGRYFDACADGRLLMLAPAAWPHTPGEKPMTRDDATAMNRLCQWLAGEGAAKIAYRGVTPADVDGAALRAARASRRKSNSF